MAAKVYIHNQTASPIILDSGLRLPASSVLLLSDYLPIDKIINSTLLLNAITNDQILLSSDGSTLLTKANSLDYQNSYYISNTVSSDERGNPLLNRALRLWESVLIDKTLGVSSIDARPYITEFIFGAQSVIFSDTFEDSTLNAWTINKNPVDAPGNWSNVSGGIIGSRAAEAAGGNSLGTYSLRRVQSVLNYTNIFLAMRVTSSGLEADDGSYIEYSTTSGSSYLTVPGTNFNGNLTDLSVGYAFPSACDDLSTFAFGIAFTGNATNDKLKVDNVELRGNLNGVAIGQSPYTSTTKSVGYVPQYGVVVASIRGTTGTVTLEVSRDGGSNWSSSISLANLAYTGANNVSIKYSNKIDLTSLVSGSSIRVRFTITGDHRLFGYGFDVWTGS